MDTSAFTIEKIGSSYQLPKYRLTSRGLEPTGEQARIEFVRGAAKTEGILIETLLHVLISDLQHKQSEVPAEEGQRTLDHLRCALDALQARTYRRSMRGVLGTQRA